MSSLSLNVRHTPASSPVPIDSEVAALTASPTPDDVKGLKGATASARQPLLFLAVSARALFDLEDETKVYDVAGVDAYNKLMIAHKTELPRPGAAFPLIKTAWAYNELLPGSVKVALVTEIDETKAGQRIKIALMQHGLYGIDKRFFAGRKDLLTSYLESAKPDVFLTANKLEARGYIKTKLFPAAVLKGLPTSQVLQLPKFPLVVAFDFDGVLADDASEQRYRSYKNEDSSTALAKYWAAEEREWQNALNNGPLYRFALKLTQLKAEIIRALPDEAGAVAPKLLLATARNSMAVARAMVTLNNLKLPFDSLTCGIGDKSKAIEAMGLAHMFFDDFEDNVTKVAKVCPAGHVRYGTFNDTPANAAATGVNASAGAAAAASAGAGADVSAAAAARAAAPAPASAAAAAAPAAVRASSSAFARPK